MTAWTSDELARFGGADELELASLCRHGALRSPVTIWVVRVGDNLYVRSWRGRGGGWFGGAQARREGHIKAGGVEKDIALPEEGDPKLNSQIDAAYRAKHSQYGAQYVDPPCRP